MVIITTDGLENASREFNYKKIKELIEKQKESGWEFVFLGANIDVYQEAHRFGISEDMVAEYNCDSEGISVNYAALNKVVNSFRVNGKADKNWHEDIDKDLAKRKNKK